MTDTSLAAALDALVAVATSAGVDPATARREGESLAATVAEPAKGAYVDWSEQTGGGRTAEDFMDAASRGRRYRAAPTPTMAGLSLARSTHAPAYAKALSDVALAAVGLGEENSRVIGNATTAAAAQLGETSPTARVQPSQPAEREQVPGVGDHFLAQMLDQLGQVQKKLTNLDLTEIDRGAPGAFDLEQLRNGPTTAGSGPGRPAAAGPSRPRPRPRPRPTLPRSPSPNPRPSTSCWPSSTSSSGSRM